MNQMDWFPWENIGKASPENHGFYLFFNHPLEFYHGFLPIVRPKIHSGWCQNVFCRRFLGAPDYYFTTLLVLEI